MKKNRLAGLLLCVLVPCIPARSEVIELKSGHKVEGDVLKERDDILYLDIGVDVVRIPLNQIHSRRKPKEQAKEQNRIQKEEIYSTARLQSRSIKDLTVKYGEGVVLIETPGGLGSGFIINNRGYCVTNFHVVEGETQIAVTVFHKSKTGEFTRRRIDDVEIISLNSFFDLALLRIPKQKDLQFRPVFLAGKDDHKDGDEVFAIGNPLGLERSVSRGIVSSRNRNFEGVVYIQTTTQINPGNSGGPLFNSPEEVVRVTNMKRVFAEGLGFAIPVAYLKHFLNNRDAFAFDSKNPNTGYRYFNPPRRRNLEKPPGR